MHSHWRHPRREFNLGELRAPRGQAQPRLYSTKVPCARIRPHVDIGNMHFARLFGSIAAASILSGVHAQTALISPPTGTKTLAATLKAYAFPGAGQVASQQSQDETECYNWAVQETSIDPFHLANQAAEQQQQAAQRQKEAQQSMSGSVLKGAVGGAAGGAIIGAIAGNAGKGAAIGAGVGASAIVPTRRAKRKRRVSKRRSSPRQLLSLAAQMTEFKKAFSACLEAKKYTVRF